MPRISTALRNATLDAGLGTQFDGGTAVLEGRSGTQPAGGDTAPTGTVIVSITIPSDAFAAAASGAIAKAGTWQDTSADNAGTITWWRMRLAGDAGTTNTTDKRLDFSASATGGGGEITVDNPALTAGQALTLNTLTITLPAT